MSTRSKKQCAGIHMSDMCIDYLDEGSLHDNAYYLKFVNQLTPDLKGATKNLSASDLMLMSSRAGDYAVTALA